MNDKDYINKEKFENLTTKIFEIATSKGWHDKPISKNQYLGLIITEVAEVVEADRNYKHANTDAMSDLLRVQAKSEEGLSEHWYDMWYSEYYKMYVKGSIEEELADVVIRILDMTKEIHGDKMYWKGDYPCGGSYNNEMNAVENACVFVKEVLNWGMMNICNSLSFIYDWADNLGIDLDKHIEWKMKYNELRPYKHGGKKY